MGGKRPDQYAIDPSETNSTDRLRLDDEKVHEADKRHVAESRVEATRESFIPKGAENPALADLRARREQEQREAERAPDAERTE
jgi:hypothetical protein